MSRSFADRLRFHSTLMGSGMGHDVMLRWGSIGNLYQRLAWRLTDRLRLLMELQQWSES